MDSARSTVWLPRLAGEFQGYCRDVHDEASETLVRLVGLDGLAAGLFEARLREARHLDRGNANPGSLGSDFARFGWNLWDTLVAADKRTVGRQKTLDRLNTARNGIAHDDQSKLAALQQDGIPLTLDTVRAWRRALDGLARTLDKCLSAHLGKLCGVKPPW